MLGLHNKIKNISVEGNPLKSIRRPIIAKGSAGILQYLADRYVEENDGKVEQWAIDQNLADKEEVKLEMEEEAKKQKEEEEERLRQKYLKEQEDIKNYSVIGGVQPAKDEPMATTEEGQADQPAED